MDRDDVCRCSFRHLQQLYTFLFTYFRWLTKNIISLSIWTKKKSTPAASGATANATVSNNEITKSTNRNIVLSRPVRRVLQNFLLIWLDPNLDEPNEDFKKSLQQLRRIVASITIFTDAQKCIKFLTEIKKRKSV
jgi:hypothetical protein